MQGFSSVYKPEKRRSGALSFAELLHECAVACPEMRIRFTSPHPKDFSDDVIKVSNPLPATSHPLCLLVRLLEGICA